MLTKSNHCYKFIIWYFKKEFKGRVIQDIRKAGFVDIRNELLWKKSNVTIEINNVKSSNPVRRTAFTVMGTLNLK